MSRADQDASHRANVSEYCRQIERHLCQKNGGHLVRVVGPAFEEVRGWAEQGIPLKIALRGIDQCCDRAFAKGPRRRPIRVEFCAADVKEVFDDWRRAVGVGAAGDELEAEPAPRKGSLPAHVERVVGRLIALRGVDGATILPASVVDEAVETLDRLAAAAAGARGEAREALIEQLAALDRTVLGAAAASIDAARATALRREAESELAPFGQRMTPEARAAALESAYLRLVRDTLRLPRIAFD
jgi:hypothetical protein